MRLALLLAILGACTVTHSPGYPNCEKYWYIYPEVCPQPPEKP